MKYNWKYLLVFDFSTKIKLRENEIISLVWSCSLANISIEGGFHGSRVEFNVFGVQIRVFLISYFFQPIYFCFPLICSTHRNYMQCLIHCLYKKSNTHVNTTHLQLVYAKKYWAQQLNIFLKLTPPKKQIEEHLSCFQQLIKRKEEN